jgi:hypothetical protein
MALTMTGVLTGLLIDKLGKIPLSQCLTILAIDTITLFLAFYLNVLAARLVYFRGARHGLRMIYYEKLKHEHPDWTEEEIIAKIQEADKTPSAASKKGILV